MVSLDGEEASTEVHLDNWGLLICGPRSNARGSVNCASIRHRMPSLNMIRHGGRRIFLKKKYLYSRDAS